MHRFFISTTYYAISATSENPTIPTIARIEMKAQIRVTNFLFFPVKIIVLYVRYVKVYLILTHICVNINKSIRYGQYSIRG